MCLILCPSVFLCVFTLIRCLSNSILALLFLGLSILNFIRMIIFDFGWFEPEKKGEQKSKTKWSTHNHKSFELNAKKVRKSNNLNKKKIPKNFMNENHYHIIFSSVSRRKAHTVSIFIRIFIRLMWLSLFILVAAEHNLESEAERENINFDYRHLVL